MKLNIYLFSQVSAIQPYYRYQSSSLSKSIVIDRVVSVLNIYNLYICLKAIHTPILNLAVISSGIPDTADIVDIYIYNRSSLVV
jgi:hypothetical protein